MGRKYRHFYMVQCSNCNSDALGFCLCDLAASPRCSSCFAEHTQTQSSVHILLPLDLDPAVISSSRVGDYIERNRKAAKLEGILDKHCKLLRVQLERHLEDLSRIEDELHAAIKRKIQILKDQACELIRTEVGAIGQLAEEVGLEAKRTLEPAISLPAEMILKCENIDLFANIQSSELRADTSSILQAITDLQGAALISLCAQLKERLAYSCLYSLQPGAKLLTALDPLRDVATVREVTGSAAFLEGMAICQFSDDQLMVAGGTWSSAVGLIDIKTRIYTGMKSMKSARAYHAIVKFKGSVYAFGGAHQQGIYKTYELNTGGDTAWTQANMPRELKDVRTVCLRDKILLTDYTSNLVESFTPASSAFKTLSLLLPCQNAYSVLIYEAEYLVILKGNTIVTCKVLEESLEEVARTTCDESAWQVWQTPVQIGKAYYFFNYNGRRVYSVEVKPLGATVSTKVNYQVIRS